MRTPDVFRSEGRPQLSGITATEGKARKDKGSMYLTSFSYISSSCQFIAI